MSIENTNHEAKEESIGVSMEDTAEIPTETPKNDSLGDILIGEDEGRYEDDGEEEDPDDEEEEEDDDEDDVPREGESMTEFYLRKQREKNEYLSQQYASQPQDSSFSNKSADKPNSPPPPYEEPEQPKKKYEGGDSWKNLDDEDYQENAIKLTQLLDTVTTEGLRKFVQMYLVEGKVIREVKVVISNFKKRAANSDFVYIEQEDYIKCLEAYVKLYEDDIPMPNNLKRALAVFFRAELKKWLAKNADSPLIAVGIAFSGWIGEFGIKVATIKSGLHEPEIVQEDDDDVEQEHQSKIVNIDHIQNKV